MVIYAKEHGVKPTAKLYAAGPKTVRKWLGRFKEGGYQALADLSRRPKRSPNKTSSKVINKIIKLKDEYKRLGAEQIIILEHLTTSAKTMRKIWRENGVSSRQRRKKHVTKQNLREIKKQFALFERVCEDTKDLDDIPEYWTAKPSAYTKAIENARLIHGAIPPGAHRFQSDAETVHNLIEVEFYEIEYFSDRENFMEKAFTYQNFFNFLRPNTYKENKSPWQIAQEKLPDIPKEALMLPPVDLDALLNKKLASLTTGGYDVYSAPFSKIPGNRSVNRGIVIPAQAGIKSIRRKWMPAFAGMTSFTPID